MARARNRFFFFVCLILNLPPALAGASPPPDAGVAQKTIQKINLLMTQERGQNIVKRQEMDQKSEALGRKIIQLKSAALAPLGEAAQNRSLALKTRVFAVNFLGLLNDPGSFIFLKSILLDSTEPDVLRAASASILFDVPVNKPTRRRVFCEILSRKKIPRLTLSQVLFEVSLLGCQDADLLKEKAESFGERPQGKKKVLSLLAIQGLGESFSLNAAQVLWSLFDFFPAGSSERGEILKSLLKQNHREIPAPPDEGLRAEAALRSESQYQENALLAIELASQINDPQAKASLTRELRNPDPAVRAAATKALGLLATQRLSERVSAGNGR